MSSPWVDWPTEPGPWFAKDPEGITQDLVFVDAADGAIFLCFDRVFSQVLKPDYIGWTFARAVPPPNWDLVEALAVAATERDLYERPCIPSERAQAIAHAYLAGEPVS